jgi:uncharacterized membrane protein YdjX (TVP38/TMEM64 family)
MGIIVLKWYLTIGVATITALLLFVGPLQLREALEQYRTSAFDVSPALFMATCLALGMLFWPKILCDIGRRQ